jgi:hypothetical protein
VGFGGCVLKVLFLFDSKEQRRNREFCFVSRKKKTRIKGEVRGFSLTWVWSF